MGRRPESNGRRLQKNRIRRSEAEKWQLASTLGRESIGAADRQVETTVENGDGALVVLPRRGAVMRVGGFLFCLAEAA
jgi:hypothetical protein